MEQEERKSPNKDNGARKIKAYNLAANISFIIGIIFKVINDDELFQDFTICGIILCIIALKNQQQIR